MVIRDTGSLVYSPFTDFQYVKERVFSSSGVIRTPICIPYHPIIGELYLLSYGGYSLVSSFLSMLS